MPIPKRLHQKVFALAIPCLPVGEAIVTAIVRPSLFARPGRVLLYSKYVYGHTQPVTPVQSKWITTPDYVSNTLYASSPDRLITCMSFRLGLL